MIIGHNPGLQAFALGMIDKSSKHPQTRNARKTINQKLPTAAFVLVEFETDSWSEVAPGTGILLDYMTPKLLADANNI
jgi:phosphohistidine phosphatase